MRLASGQDSCARRLFSARIHNTHGALSKWNEIEVFMLREVEATVTSTRRPKYTRSTYARRSQEDITQCNEQTLRQMTRNGMSVCRNCASLAAKSTSPSASLADSWGAH